MAIRFQDGQAIDHGEPVVVVAVWIDPTEPVARLRTSIREAAEDGFGGVAVEEGEAEAVKVVRDAARRAGLAALLPGDQLADEPHALAIDDPLVAVADDPVAAFEALFDGATVIVGAEDAAYALRDFLRLTDDAAAWEPLESQGNWRFRGTERERAALAPAGGDVRLEIARDFEGAIHWIDPEDGTLVAAVRATPGEPHEVRVDDGVPMLLYLGPNRYELDTTLTKPK